VTIRARVVLALFILSTLGAFATGWNPYFNLAYLWGGLLLIAFIWSRLSLRGLQLERRPRSIRTQVGRSFEESFILRNHSRFPKLWVEIRDHSELPGHRASTVKQRLGFGKQKTWIVRTICIRRGRFRIGIADLHSGDPFGLFPQEERISQEFFLVVMPRTERLRSSPLRAGRLPGGDATRQRTHQVTPNASGVREYAPGDAMNRIHWKSTARLRRLITKEFEFDPQAEVWILLDANALVHAGDVEEQSASLVSRVVHGDIDLPRSTEEYAVAIVAAITFFLLERNREVGLIAHGSFRHIIQSDRGVPQLYRILESLAVLEAEGSNPLDAVLKVEEHRIPRGASLVIVTPSVEPTVIRTAQELVRKGIETLLILLDPMSFGGEGESNGVFISAQSAGIPVRQIRYGDSIAQSLAQTGGFRVVPIGV
jgi:uncharacterized protein (DUF58 family)